MVIRTKVLKVGMDDNGWFWNKEALQDMIRCYKGKKYVYDKSMKYKIGKIKDVSMSDDYVVVVADINLKLCKKYGVNIKNDKFAGIAKIEYGLTGVMACDKLVFD